MNYNTQLCNTAWGKVFVAHSHWFLFSADVLGIQKLLERWQRSGNWIVKRSFYYRTKKNVLVTTNEISEMKQTNN